MDVLGETQGYHWRLWMRVNGVTTEGFKILHKVNIKAKKVLATKTQTEWF